MNNSTSIWGTMAVDAVSVAYAEATGDMAAALSLATGASVVEDVEKQFAGEQFDDAAWASV